MLDKLTKNKKIILFDGVCNFCNLIVLKIIKHDSKDLFVFTSLQSETGKEITNHLNIDTSKIDSIILFETENNFHIKSNAALRIMQLLGGFWKATALFKILPVSFRDSIYNYIAKNRYSWFGKKDTCMIPSPRIKSKFI
ncbi:MAG: putative DCC family thiol-disulfide oxidoreductase YuxK [Polaribacter sp.]|jgi:predicted DCC family thiol-disulfide oxidoreductase YuxK